MNTGKEPLPLTRCVSLNDECLKSDQTIGKGDFVNEIEFQSNKESEVVCS